jgi:allophanate hydrolase
LYDGPWVEERTLAVGGFLKANPDAGFPVTRQIICKETSASAMDLFEAMYRLNALKRTTDRIMAGIDVLVTPTCGTCYTIAQETADPIALKTTLGYYTNYMNLLDYCGLAVPAGMGGRLPFGVTLAGPAFSENFLLRLGHRLHRQAGLAMGTGADLPPDQSPAEADVPILLAVCGAHLKGLPLHHQLVDLKARLVSQTRTAACYRMVALETDPPKPGLIRDPDKGESLEVEVYALDARAFGQFVAQIPHPLGIGKIELADGTWVPGFIAEPVVLNQGKEITRFGGWRAYLNSLEA